MVFLGTLKVNSQLVQLGFFSFVLILFAVCYQRNLFFLQICFDGDMRKEAMHKIYAWLRQSSVGLCQTKRCSIKREVIAFYIMGDIGANVN